MSTESSVKRNKRTLGEWLNIDGISYIPSTVLLTGIPKVSLKDNHLFASLDTKGESPRVYNNELGFYFNDTRFLSTWEMTINDQQLVYLSHELRSRGDSCIFSMTNRDLPTLDEKSRIPRDTLLIRRILTFHHDTAFEHLEITNYDVVPLDLEIRQTASSRFDDIFEVRGKKRPSRGELFAPSWNNEKGQGLLSYKGLDGIFRKTNFSSLTAAPDGEVYEDSLILTHKITIPGKARHEVKTVISFSDDAMSDHVPDADNDGKLLGNSFKEMTVAEHLSVSEKIESKARLGTLRFHSSNEVFDRTVKNARLDIEMLSTVQESGEIYPYAGIPWFSAPFGRDGLITAYQTLPWHPQLAKGVLDYVFKMIGTKQNLFTDEEPGKIFHEMRRGEMANMKEIPYIPYYGSVDSTPLALILLGEYYAWTRDLPKVREWWPFAKKAVEWMDVWGDADGDLFLEYIKKSPTGLENQGWKDSHNSIMHANGALADAPIKLCEVQAYAYRAKKAMAGLARVLKDEDYADELTRKADQLRQKFTEKYWDTKDHYLYLALDRKNLPCEVMSSNQGHCLWGGILDQTQAKGIADHLMSPRLFSGYGIRTLASDEKAFNPLSYHNGSIWPHDNSLIAEGLRSYGLHHHLQKLCDSLFDVVASIGDHRLPELFCGFRRQDNEPPIPYEVACRPQAWAAGSIFLFLKSLLGCRMSPAQDALIFQNPHLPSKVDYLQIQGFRVQDSEFDFVVKRGGNQECHVEMTRRSGPLQVLIMK